MQGAIGVELDVALTSDQQVVVMHDPHVDRTTECTGCISEMTLEEARACRARDADGEEIFVPSLAEALDALAALPVRPLIMIDTKIGMDDCPIPAESTEEQETLLGRGVADALVAAGVDDIAGVQAQGATLLAALRQVTPRPVTLFAKGGMDEALGVAEQHASPVWRGTGAPRGGRHGSARRDDGRLVDTFVVNARSICLRRLLRVDIIETDDPTDLSRPSAALRGVRVRVESRRAGPPARSRVLRGRVPGLITARCQLESTSRAGKIGLRRQVREGLGLLWKEARQTATASRGARQDPLGKSLEEAGREVERAVTTSPAASARS